MLLYLDRLVEGTGKEQRAVKDKGVGRVHRGGMLAWSSQTEVIFL
jgi:hypothetical protein